VPDKCFLIRAVVMPHFEPMDLNGGKKMEGNERQSVQQKKTGPWKPDLKKNERPALRNLERLDGSAKMYRVGGGSA